MVGLAFGVLHGTADWAEGDEHDDALEVLVAVSVRLSDAESVSGRDQPAANSYSCCANRRMRLPES